MIRETFPVGLLRCNCTILGDEISRDAAVIDPGDDIPRILVLLAKHTLTVTHIFVTHAHIDHIAGALELKRITGAPILYNQNDIPLLATMEDQAAWLGIEPPKVAPPDDNLVDGYSVAVGPVLGKVIHTPGHTQGSTCVYFPSQALLLAGDTLFAGSVGRTDLPGGNTRTLIQSIRDRLLTLPDETLVIPGHGANTSIGAERDSNPFLQSN